MKLRNKKTGEIADVKIDTYNENGKGDRICLSVRDGEDLYRCIASYPSLAELNAEWEDYNGRFRLVKDLPTFKAGQVFHLSPKGNLVLDDGKFGICAYARQTLEKFPNILEDWFEPIDDESKNAIDIDKVNELIDKIHPEPRIKDSRVCRIVRDWYEYHDTDIPIYCEDACTLSINHCARIEFLERVFRNLEQDYGYDITELCGDEK